MSKVDTILEEIKGLTLLEASDLVKEMEDRIACIGAPAAVSWLPLSGPFLSIFHMTARRFRQFLPKLEACYLRFTL